MSLEYELSLNKLTTPDSYSARVRPRDTVDTASLAAAIAASSTMSPADVTGVLMALASQVQTQLLAGNWVQIDGIGILTTSIKARVPTITDPLPADARVELGFRAAPSLREQVQAQAEYERVEPADQSPLLLTLTAQTGGGLQALGENDVLRFVGDRMKFKPTALDEGVFLLEDGEGVTRVTNYLQNTDRELQFAIPTGLPSGPNYTIQVRARRTGSIALRTTAWPATVTVA